MDPKSMRSNQGQAKAAKAAHAPDVQKIPASRADVGAGTAGTVTMSQGATTIVAITALAAGFAGAYGWQQSMTAKRSGESLISQEALQAVDERTETIVVEATAALDSLSAAHEELRHRMEELSHGPRARALASEALYGAWIAFAARDAVEELGRSIAEKQGVLTRLEMAIDNERVLHPQRVRRDAKTVREWARRDLARCSAALQHLEELSARADSYRGPLPQETVAERIQREAAEESHRALIERRARAREPDLNPPLRVR